MKSKNEKRIFVAPVLLACLTLFGCKNSATTHRVQFVDRNALASHSITPQPLFLIVEIDETGRLRLNKIETGSTADTALLAEKLEAIFADREKSGIDEREVLIDSKVRPETEIFEEVVRTLVDAKASPIRVIKNNP